MSVTTAVPGPPWSAAPSVPNDLLAISDLDGDTITSLLDLAVDLKSRPEAFRTALAGRSVALLFEKPSLRTRASLEVGLHRLGAQPVVFDMQDSPIGARECVHDLGRYLERWFHAVAARVHGHAVIEELARCCDVPVLNTLSDLHHPCQALADLLTLHERGIDFRASRIAFVGDGNNVCHSLAEAIVAVGGSIVVVAPDSYGPSAEVVARTTETGRSTGGSIEIAHDPAAVEGCAAVYTDTWISMGEIDSAAKKQTLAAFQVNERLMSIAGDHALFMHCLPAHRGEEVVDAVIDGPNSVVFDQAENRLHAQNAWFVARLG